MWRVRARDRVRGLRARWRNDGPRESAALLAVLQGAPEGDVGAALGALEAFSQGERRLMHIGPEKGALLDAVVAEHRPERVLELGSFLGYSALRLGRATAPWGGAVHTVERNPRCAAVARAVAAHAGLADRVTVLCGPSDQLLPTLRGRWDLIVLDHAKEHYLRDLRALELSGGVGPGTVVFADNVGVFADDLADYLAHMSQPVGWTTRRYAFPLPDGSGLEDAVEVSVRR